MTVLRADAERNLGLILAAAADAYAELGPDVTIDEIARRAGVGHGTVCRRFPTKDALRAAVIHARLDELLATAQGLLEEPDAWAAVERFVWEVADSCLRDRAPLRRGSPRPQPRRNARRRNELSNVGRNAKRIALDRYCGTDILVRVLPRRTRMSGPPGG